MIFSEWWKRRGKDYPFPNREQAQDAWDTALRTAWDTALQHKVEQRADNCAIAALAQTAIALLDEYTQERDETLWQEHQRWCDLVDAWRSAKAASQ